MGKRLQFKIQILFDSTEITKYSNIKN